MGDGRWDSGGDRRAVVALTLVFGLGYWASIIGLGSWFGLKGIGPVEFGLRVRLVGLVKLGLYTPIWVQIWGLPLEYITPYIALNIGALVGNILQVDWNAIMPMNIRYLRVKESWSNRAHVPKLYNGQYDRLNEQMDKIGKRYNVGISMDLEGVHFINKIRAYERRPEKRNTVVQFFNQEDDWDQTFILVMEEPIQDMEELGRQKRGHCLAEIDTIPMRNFNAGEGSPLSMVTPNVAGLTTSTYFTSGNFEIGESSKKVASFGLNETLHHPTNKECVTFVIDISELENEVIFETWLKSMEDPLSDQ
ncbi:hypothetical protein Goklo_002101 [Gossypium klotzschianum]|uniref:Uncharacterized protein n=1 Tax=Gossypium klotzschianum TaxID=34286 RepID=A0A7J8VSQ6_9ROSI|nr:hypothetical protein [Gossypium klotzschianum]